MRLRAVDQALWPLFTGARLRCRTRSLIRLPQRAVNGKRKEVTDANAI
jgi:hypothetical protein